MKINRKDLLMLLLYAKGATGEFREPIKGRTRFTKFVFIFEREIYRKFRFNDILEEKQLPKFLGWKYGPFSKDVFDDLEFLNQLGFVEIISQATAGVFVEESDEYHHWKSEIEYYTVEGTSEYTEEEFRLAELGVKYVESKRLYDDLSENQKEVLAAYKKRFNSTPLYTLLQYVYREYPDMIDKSWIKDKFGH